ncbi:putative sensor domain DACNV-containing protein [Albibacterium sp.]|uniref:putative sensor domain DACNV-containing protein n=1 Tax=Albibacterium sp. TaxID=2952885 RepID=UPI002BC3F28C|nr:hypothetical protein [Albibacterium sp.]HUH18279.1 hypothetical protein [Albibacterium sp.]
MISEPTYLPAKIVSSEIKEYFIRQQESNQQKDFLVPETYVIEAIIDTAFWASLRHEEGYTPKISIAYLPPQTGQNNLILKHHQRLTPHHLVKLSPAVIEPGIHLGVWHDDENLCIWGTTHNVPASCLVLEVIEAGLLVIKQKHEAVGRKFINLAVLKGNQIKMIDERQWGLSKCPDILSSLLGIPIPTFAGKSVNILVELALAMRRHGRGALMLITPSNTSSWLKSIVQPISYRLNPAYDLLPESMDEEPDLYEEYEAQLHRAINSIGGFSAVDGATIITRDHKLLAFGAKVARSDVGLPVAQILLSEPIKNGKPELLDSTKIGGTRHLAAAQFVHDQRDAMAMVASQDGLFTVFIWSDELNMVHAHRIDSLLL